MWVLFQKFSFSTLQFIEGKRQKRVNTWGKKDHNVWNTKNQKENTEQKHSIQSFLSSSLPVAPSAIYS